MPGAGIAKKAMAAIPLVGGMVGARPHLKKSIKLLLIVVYITFYPPNPLREVLFLRGIGLPRSEKNLISMFFLM
jgi:hypothetical protein